MELTDEQAAAIWREYGPSLAWLGFVLLAGAKLPPAECAAWADGMVDECRRRGLLSASGPPLRAATVISRISLVNILPRLAS